MKVTVDRERCTGHGRCYTLVPELFEPDDDGYGLAINATIRPGFEDRARIGVMNCPEDAIVISDNDEEETAAQMLDERTETTNRPDPSGSGS